MSGRDGVGLFFMGLLVGALSGAIAALLFAPQSGADTRMIKDKSIELRDKAQQTAEQARAKTDEVYHQFKDQMQSVCSDGVKLPETEAA